MGAHLHLAAILVDDSASDEVHHRLADAILADARGAGKLSVAYPDYSDDLATYYRKYFGASEAFRLKRYTINAQLGQSFYKSQEYDKTDASVIDGWALAVGRLTSPRALWESEWIEPGAAFPRLSSAANTATTSTLPGMRPWSVFISSSTRSATPTSTVGRRGT